MFTHLDKKDRPQMVDVGGKETTERRATARAVVKLPAEVLEVWQAEDLQTKKGSVIHTAVLAGIQGTKRTSELIPLCHPLPLNKASVEISRNPADPSEIWIDCDVSTDHKTGVEMEALTGAMVAALTIYDMCKSLSHDIVVKDVQLMQKSGGKRDFQRKENQ